MMTSNDPSVRHKRALSCHLTDCLKAEVASAQLPVIPQSGRWGAAEHLDSSAAGPAARGRFPTPARAADKSEQ